MKKGANTENIRQVCRMITPLWQKMITVYNKPLFFCLYTKIMCRKLIYILLLFLLASCGAGRSLKRAEQSYARGEYFDAAKYYRKAYAATPPKQRKQRGEIAYKMAGCYRLINYNVRAKGAYMNAIRYHYPDSVTHFYLAESLRKNGEYKPAIASYKPISNIALMIHWR